MKNTQKYLMRTIHTLNLKKIIIVKIIPIMKENKN